MMSFSSGADDRETPLRAVQDAVAAISLIFPSASAPLRIYDPYYCNGAIKARLQECGTFVVHNDPVDCYEAQKNNTVPEFDILLSNPPYSGDHVQRALQYAISCEKPWALLLPSHVLQRSWYITAAAKHIILYIAPHERYSFEVPSSSIQLKSSGNGSSSHVPFVTMWFIGGLTSQQTKYLQAYNRHGATLARSLSDLPRRIRKLLPFLEKRADKKRNNEKSNEKAVNTKKRKRQKT